jgi:hypothetical protein
VVTAAVGPSCCNLATDHRRTTGRIAPVLLQTGAMAADVFSASPDPHRCAATSRDGRRCQLQKGHGRAHAHAWREPSGPPHRGGALPPVELVRWDDEREWVEEWTDQHSDLRWQTLLLP